MRKLTTFASVLALVAFAGMASAEDIVLIPGPPGPQGEQGPIGPVGPQGEPGVDGLDGTNGTNGVDGAVGLQGPIGPVGPQGEPGVDGLDGTNGTNGVDGVDGLDGTNGTNGTNGVDGVDGTNGVDGANGVDGTNGVDGLDVDSAALDKRFKDAADAASQNDAAVAGLGGLEMRQGGTGVVSWSVGLAGVYGDDTSDEAISGGLHYGINENMGVYGKISKSFEGDAVAVFVGMEGQF